jgi:hypothetical protein
MASPAPAADTAIEVIARVRPMSAHSAAAPAVAVEADGATLAVNGTRFAFTAAAAADASQAALFDLAGRRAADAALAGYNCTLFAYGQTGSGKTHTIYGAPAGDARGLLPRTIEYVFAGMRAQEAASGGKTKFTARASFLEVRAARARARARARRPLTPARPAPPAARPARADLQRAHLRPTRRGFGVCGGRRRAPNPRAQGARRVCGRVD